MNANTEASANIGHLTIVIDRRKQSKTIDDEDLGTCGLLRCRLRVAHHTASLQQIHDLS